MPISIWQLRPHLVTLFLYISIHLLQKSLFLHTFCLDFFFRPIYWRKVEKRTKKFQSSEKQSKFFCFEIFFYFFTPPTQVQQLLVCVDQGFLTWVRATHFVMKWCQGCCQLLNFVLFILNKLVKLQQTLNVQITTVLLDLSQLYYWK